MHCTALNCNAGPKEPRPWGSNRLQPRILLRGLLPLAVETQPRPKNAMERNGRGVGAGGGDQLAILKVGQGALDRAAGEAGASGDRLMG